jgi:hypothetical protein
MVDDIVYPLRSTSLFRLSNHFRSQYPCNFQTTLAAQQLWETQTPAKRDLGEFHGRFKDTLLLLPTM